MNGKVLFIIHDNYQKDNHFPSGPAYMAAVLRNQGAKVQIYSMDVYHYTNEDLAEFLQLNTFELIGVGFLAARFNETIRDLSKVINRYKKDAWFVMGGHGPSPIPEYILKTTYADVIVIGEGEETIIELLKCKLNNCDLSSVKGIAYRDGEEVFINKRRRPIKIDSLPLPAWDLFPMEKYLNSIKRFGMDENDKGIGISTARGCINKCNFCYRMEKGIRVRKISNVMEEIKILKEQYNVEYFFINDELFVYPRKRIFDFQNALLDYDLEIKYSCDARVDVFDEEVINALKLSGCQFITFGFESSSQKVLDQMNKNTTVEQNIQAAELTNDMGIGIGLNFLWGNIGDDEESLWNNVKLIKKYNTYYQVRTIRPPGPYPGSDLYYYAINKGLLTGPDDFFNKFKNSDLMVVNFTEIPDHKFYKMLYEANKDLILDHYTHTSKDIKAANQLIKDFYNLYFKGQYNFRGSRHYTADTVKVRFG